MTVPPVVLRDLRSNLFGADDAQIAKVVSLLDTMADRGSADLLLAPLRPRLTQIRPRRPLSLTRLLFLPVDPIIVAAPHWRRLSLSIPRTALAPLSAQFRSLMAPAAADLDQQLDGHSVGNRAVVLDRGTMLWPLAADIFATSTMPGSWPDITGLTEADYIVISRALSVLLHQGRAIETMALEATSDAPADVARIRACLTNAAERSATATDITGAQPVGMLLAILLARLPHAEALITIAGDLAAALADPAARQAADKAIDFILDGIEAGTTSQGASPGASHPDLATATESQIKTAALLDVLEGSGPASRPVRKLRAAKLRRQIDTDSRARFATDMIRRVLTPVGHLGPAATDDDIITIENAARDLRRFEAASRALGGSDHYDRLLKETARALSDTVAGRTNMVDIARLVEILQGPEQALALLRT